MTGTGGRAVGELEWSDGFEGEIDGVGGWRKPLLWRERAELKTSRSRSGSQMVEGRDG